MDMENKEMGENYKFFQNKECEYFPCHPTKNAEHFNCMFCYCPLYALKDKCGGNFRYMENGVKDCSECTLPHGQNSHDYVMGKINQVIRLGMRE